MTRAARLRRPSWVVGAALLLTAVIPPPMAHAAWISTAPVIPQDQPATITAETPGLVTASDQMSATWPSLGVYGEDDSPFYVPADPDPILKSTGSRTVGYYLAGLSATTGTDNGVPVPTATPITLQVASTGTSTTCDSDTFEAAGGTLLANTGIGNFSAPELPPASPPAQRLSNGGSDNLCTRYVFGDGTGLPDLAGLWGDTVTVTQRFRANTYLPGTDQLSNWTTAPVTWKQSFDIFVPPPVNPISPTVACDTTGLTVVQALGLTISVTGDITLNWDWPLPGSTETAAGFEVFVNGSRLTGGDLDDLATNGAARSVTFQVGLLTGLLGGLVALLGLSTPPEITIRAVAGAERTGSQDFLAGKLDLSLVNPTCNQ